MKKEIKKAGVHSIDDVCKSAKLFYQYSFSGYLFTKDACSRSVNHEILMSNGEVDTKSIM